MLGKQVIEVDVKGGNDQSAANLELEWRVICKDPNRKKCELPSKRLIQFQLEFKNALEVS